MLGCSNTWTKIVYERKWKLYLFVRRERCKWDSVTNTASLNCRKSFVSEWFCNATNSSTTIYSHQHRSDTERNSTEQQRQLFRWKKKKSKRNQRKRIEKHKYFVEFSHATENISKTSWKLIDYLRKYLDEWHYGSLVLKFQKSDAHRAAHRRQGVWKDEKLRFARDEQKSSTPTNVNDRWCIQINNVWHTRHERNTPSDSHLP